MKDCSYIEIATGVICEYCGHTRKTVAFRNCPARASEPSLLPGTELTRIFFNMHFKSNEGCGCASIAREMNSLGPDYVAANLNYYALKILDNAEKLNAKERMREAIVAALKNETWLAMKIAANNLGQAWSLARGQELDLVPIIRVIVQEAVSRSRSALSAADNSK